MEANLGRISYIQKLMDRKDCWWGYYLWWFDRSLLAQVKQNRKSNNWNSCCFFLL